MSRNSKVIELLEEMAALLAMDGVAFKPRAYEQAAHSLEMLTEDVDDIYEKGGVKALEDIPGIGAGIAEKIEEYLKHGRIKEHDALKKKFPVDVMELMQIEGLGPKSVLKLYKEETH